MTTYYRKRALTPMTPWTEATDMTGVSVAPGVQPSPGDMIAWDPANPKDRWLVTAAYLRAHYEPSDDKPHWLISLVRHLAVFMALAVLVIAWIDGGAFKPQNLDLAMALLAGLLSCLVISLVADIRVYAQTKHAQGSR